MGRPTLYTTELGTTICERLANGESLRTIAKSEEMPSAETVCRWLLDGDHEDFRLQYVRAREIQAEVMFDDILDISDDGTNDWMTVTRRDGAEIEVKDREVVDRSKLRVDARKWYLSKVKPKKYGDKLDLTTDGDKLPAPIYGGLSVQGHDGDKKDILPPKAD